jgi:hypothetical protein
MEKVPHDNRKVVGCFLLIFLPICACSGPHIISNLVNRIKWSSQSIHDYTISYDSGGAVGFDGVLGAPVTLTIDNGAVTEVRPNDYRYRCDTCKPNDYQQYSVDNLFNAALRLSFSPFAHITYDPKYGYPASFSGGLIEWGYVGIWVQPIIEIQLPSF